MKKIIITLLLVLCLPYIYGQEEQAANNHPAITFDKSTVKAFETMPIQHQGRVKPLYTVASVLLLKINGKRTVRDNGVTYTPMSWLLLAWFYPQIAYDQKVFLVDNSEVLESFNYPDPKPRDRYSFNQLAPYLSEIFEKTDFILKKDKKTINLLDKQIIALADSLKEYLEAVHAFDSFKKMPLISELGIEKDKTPREIALTIDGTRKKIEDLPKLKDFHEEGQKFVQEELNKIEAVARQRLSFSEWLCIFPHEDPNQKWFSPHELVFSHAHDAAYDTTATFTTIEKTIGELQVDGSNSGTLINIANAIHQQVAPQPAMKSYSSKINLEVNYYHWNLIYNSLILFVFVFLSTSISLMAPKNITWNKINLSMITIPTFLLTMAIIIRSVILGRPPVATLYETVLFVTAIICIISIYIERIFKNKLSLFVCSVIGAGGLFLSYRYEISEGTDTMGNLAAVLNSNFWLATHVTTVTIGYSAGLLASAFAHVYLVSKIFRITNKPKFYFTINKIIYGVICFCTIFTTIGTILGGIWANNSWGRFWGWDPKENGALAIVLWCLLMLHARMGGHVREFGMIILAVICGMVVVASWWGVNQLGVGLHSYGFTEGITNKLILFAVIECSLIAFAVLHRYAIEPKMPPPEQADPTI